MGGSYRINCKGGANDCQVSSFNKEAPFLHSDDSIVVLNIKKEARVGLKTASAHCSSMSSVNSIDDDGFELLLGTRSSLLWPTL